MPFVAVDKDGQELMSKEKPQRDNIFGMWIEMEEFDIEYLDNGSIEKLTGKKLRWKDEPLEVEEGLKW